MSKPKGYNYNGICCMCKEPFVKAYRRPHQIFCGSAKERIGCSYKNQLILSTEWAKNNKDKIKIIDARWYVKHKKI